MGSKDTNSRLVSAQGLCASIALAVSISGICWAQKPELVVQIGHSGPVNSVAISSDDKTLASGSTDKTIKFWDVTSCTELFTLRGHTDYVLSVVFSLDGKTLASGSADETIKLWDVMNGSDLLTLRSHAGLVRSVVFGPDGKTIA